jgi:hypothetical protein
MWVLDRGQRASARLDAPPETAKIAFAGQLGWLTSTLDGSLIYLAAFILSRKYAALMMKSTPGLMKRAMPLRLRTHSFGRIGCIAWPLGSGPMVAQVHGSWMPGTSGVHGRSSSVTSSVRVRLWLGAIGQRLCLLVCAGQAVFRTVSVAVRGMGRLGCPCARTDSGQGRCRGC